MTLILRRSWTTADSKEPNTYQEQRLGPTDLQGELAPAANQENL